MRRSRKQVWMFQPQRPRCNLALAVQGQSLDAGSPNCRHSLNAQAVGGPAEMHRPSLSSRIKQRYGGLAFGVPARGEGLLLLLTRRATQRQVCERRFSTTTFRNHMVESKSETEEDFRGLTVLTAMPGTLGNGLVERPKVGRR